MSPAPPVSIIIVPGWRDSAPSHWQSLWAVRLPHARRVVQTTGSRPRARRGWASWIESGHGEWPLRLALQKSLTGEQAWAGAPQAAAA